VAKSTIVAFPICASLSVDTVSVPEVVDLTMGSPASSSPSLDSEMAVASDNQSQCESSTTATTAASSLFPIEVTRGTVEDMSQTDDGNGNTLDGNANSEVNGATPLLLSDHNEMQEVSEAAAASNENREKEVGFLVFNFQGVGERL